MDRKSNNTALNYLVLKDSTISKCENGSSGPIYIGYAEAGSADADAKWQIKKMTYDVNGFVTSILYADSSNNYDKKWSLRATYTYG